MMKISGRNTLDQLLIFLGVFLVFSLAEDCSQSRVFVANFKTQLGSDGTKWVAPYVIMGLYDNNQQVTPGPDPKGVDLNIGTTGPKIFMGAELVTVCLNSTTQVVSAMIMSPHPDCPAIGDGWVAEAGHVNVNEGVPGANPLWLCLRYGPASDQNLFASHFYINTYTTSSQPFVWVSGDLNDGKGTPIRLQSQYNSCGRKCQNGGLCFKNSCVCPSRFIGQYCESTMPNVMIESTSACSFNISTTGGTAPYKYTVNGGSKTSNSEYQAENPGNYSVKSFDATGYSVSSSVSVVASTVSALPSSSSVVSSVNVYASSADNDEASFSVSGAGRAPVKYTLTPSKTGYSYIAKQAKFSNIAVGTYTLTATDADGCKSQPTTITVLAKTLPKPPTDVSASIRNVNNKAIATATWVAPVNTGYTEITGYAVSWGYVSSSGSIRWSYPQVVDNVLSFSAEDYTVATSTARYVKVAAINSVGTGSNSSPFMFQGLCAAGTYYNTTACAPCAAGYNTFGSIGKSACRACAAGTYSATTGSPTCQTCTGNTYSKSAATTCATCPSGSISINKQSCQACPPGSFAVRGDSSCSPCAENTFAASAGSSSCSPCPEGLTSEQGASSCTDESGYKK